MRARAGPKRQEIIRIATELLEERGYERTSMSEIAARVGGSKATLYAYFHSKEQLLRAVLEHDVNEETDPAAADAFLKIYAAQPEPGKATH